MGNPYRHHNPLASKSIPYPRDLRRHGPHPIRTFNGVGYPERAYDKPEIANKPLHCEAQSA
jgi:hypothetical protein